MNVQAQLPLLRVRLSKYRLSNMRQNFETVIYGKKVVLVPYRRIFVEKYHEWMKDPYLQEMTASEPLSIEEEYEMQLSWRDDPKKCTFIVLGRKEETEGLPEDLLEVMAGDVNMFFNDRDDATIAELEVMIAEESYRRKGLGREAVHLMMHYGATVLGVTKFYVKINQANDSSIELFKSLGFVEVNYVPAFEEYEFQFVVGSASTVDSTEASNRGVLVSRAEHAVYGTYAHPTDTEAL